MRTIDVCKLPAHETPHRLFEYFQMLGHNVTIFPNSWSQNNVSYVSVEYDDRDLPSIVCSEILQRFVNRNEE